ncbi:pro-opiomelanocortin-like [Ammospiza maritima maritima]
MAPRPLLLLWGFLLCGPAGASGPRWDSAECGPGGGDAGAAACSGGGSCRARLSRDSPVVPVHPGQPRAPSAWPRRYVMGHFRWNHFGPPKNGTEEAARKRENEEEEAGKAGRGVEGSTLRAKDGKRSYSMEHFRWGKPVGRKRRPVKVFPNEEEEEDSRISELRRDEGSEGDEEGEGEEGDGEWPWGWRKEKRYGGFMGAERAPTPLLTLFRNAIGRSFAKDGR